VSERLRILAVGDKYVTAEAFRRGLEHALGDEHDVDVIEVGDDDGWLPETDSERRVREYAGSPAQVAEHLDGHDVLVVHGAPVTQDVLTTPGLRLVCCARGGPVNIDLQAAGSLGIPVTTTPGKNAQAVVELTLAFLIMLARGVPRAQTFLLENGQLASTFDGAEFFGVELGGRTLGLVGYGQVGRRVGEAAVALGMTTLAFDPAVGSDAFCDGVTGASFERVLAKSDFVSLHARATAENENMMGAREFAAIPKGGFFINTARETLVDEAALYDALESGHLGGAGLDVARLSNGRRNGLLDFRNVIITPHIGGATLETIDRGIAMVAAEIERFSRHDPLLFAR
jgi:D-3-phosphoglycerate dehydrogenase